MAKKRRRRRYLLGVDPGLDGGIVLIDDRGKIRRKHPIPRISRSGPPDLREIHRIIRSYAHLDVHIWMEEIQRNLFGFGKSTVASLFQLYGQLEAIFVSLDIPYSLVLHKEWQAEMYKGVKPIYKVKKKGQKSRTKDTKAMALAVSQRLYPKEKFLKTEKSRTPHDGLIDATLVAEYGRRKLIGTNGSQR